MNKELLSIGMVASVAVLAIGVGGISPTARAAAGGTISGRIINDLNGDGVEQPGEPGLVDWRIVLEKDVEEGQTPLVWETRTSRDGKYVFENLPIGNYSLSVPCDGEPGLWIDMWPNDSGSAGAEITEDSPNNDYLALLIKTIDAPPSKDGSIAGRIVWDENRDGVADPSEPGVAGWQVNGGSGGGRCFPQQYQVTYTAPDGSFHFSGLAAGAYGLDGLGPSGVPHPDYVVDFPGTSSQSGDGFPSFQFQPHVDVPENGTGNLLIGLLNVSGTSSISGAVYWDKNSNGFRDADEPLVDCDCWMGLMYRTPKGYAPVDSRITTAAAHGAYAYDGLAAGDYWVAIMQPPGQGGFSFRLISVGEGGSIGNIDFGLAPNPDSALPTVAPVVPLADTGTPAAVPPASSTPVAGVSIGLPSTGDGPPPANGGSLSAALAFAAFGFAAFAFTARRHVKGRPQR